MSARSQLITYKQGNACYLHFLLTSCHADSSRGDIYTDHQSTDDQCALMICVAPAVPPVSVHQCQLSVLIHATCQCHISATFQCLPVHINATYQCPSELPLSVTHQCQSVPPISAAYQCTSVLPISTA
ncbi:unnamed protein product [Staurois parvus]|uniref:Uncharacterized protein n=1 Tax=Staurois parvus TaxID=386267 RepID=A0ABN9ELF7_9NEOB|nr:unnamed protein product [Staurois parvus]